MRTVAPPQRSRFQIRLAGVQCNASFLFGRSRCLIAEPFKRSFPNGRHSLTRWLAGRPRGQLYETQACLPHLLHRLLSLPASSLSFSQAVILFFLAIFHFSRLSPTPPSLSGLLVSFFSPPSPFPGSAPTQWGEGGTRLGEAVRAPGLKASAFAEDGSSTKAHVLQVLLELSMRRQVGAGGRRAR